MINRPYPSHPFPPSLAKEVSKFPSGFRELALQSALGIDILHIISRISNYMTSKSRAFEINTAVRTVPAGAVPDIFDTCAILQTSAANGHMVERNICLAIILFAYNVYSMVRDATTVYRGSRLALTRTLPATKYANRTERDCLIWIYMVTVESWRAGEILAPQGRELLGLMLDRFDEAAEWTKLQVVMRNFFWYEPLAHQWKLCWQQRPRQQKASSVLQQRDSPESRRAELHAIWEGRTPVRPSKSKRSRRA